MQSLQGALKIPCQLLPLFWSQLGGDLSQAAIDVLLPAPIGIGIELGEDVVCVLAGYRGRLNRSADAVHMAAHACRDAAVPVALARQFLVLQRARELAEAECGIALGLSGVIGRDIGEVTDGQ